MIYLPVVVCATRRRALDTHVALEHQVALRQHPLAVGLAVRVERTVVDTQVAGVVGHRHRGPYRAANTHGPVEVLVPIGAVAATDISHGAAVAILAQQRLAEAGCHLELVGQAAVAYHQAKLLRVGHGGHVARGEVGRSPTGGAAVGAVVDQSGALVVASAHRGRHRTGAALHRHVAHARRHDGGVVLEVHHLLVAVCPVDVVGDGIVHGGVGMGVAVVAAAAAVDASHHDGAVEERRVGEGVLLVHERLLHLRRQLGDGLCREATVIAVRQVVAAGPSGVVEVGDVVGRRSAAEGGQLLVVADQQQIGGRRVGGGSTAILTLDVCLYGCGGGAHGGVVGVDNVGQEAFAFLPCHKVVQLAAEHAVGHY